jgi:hypothetical protein
MTGGEVKRARHITGPAGSIHLLARSTPKSRPRSYLEARIRLSVVPQTGHLPCNAGRPFFIVTCLASAIDRLALHLTQYASGFASAMFTSLQSTPRRGQHIVTAACEHCGGAAGCWPNPRASPSDVPRPGSATLRTK